MAHWFIEVQGGMVRLAYSETLEGERKDCGKGEEALLSNLEAWVIEEAEPHDIVHMLQCPPSVKTCSLAAIGSVERHVDASGG